MQIFNPSTHTPTPHPHHTHTHTHTLIHIHFHHPTHPTTPTYPHTHTSPHTHPHITHTPTHHPTHTSPYTHPHHSHTHRVLRQIFLCIRPILDVIVLLILFLVIFSLLGQSTLSQQCHFLEWLSRYLTNTHSHTHRLSHLC